MTYLVTGAAGFFGQRIVRALASTGMPVVATDRDVRPASLAATEDGVEWISFDVARTPLPAALLRRYTAIVHAAALTLPPEWEQQEKERIIAVNVEGTRHVLELARQTGTRAFVQISSSGVYRRSHPGPLRETDADGGDSVYGWTKFDAERLVREACAQSALRATILRPCSLYGPGEMTRASRPVVSPIWHLARASHLRQSVGLVNPESRREWLAVEDAAEAVAVATRRTAAGYQTADRVVRVLNLGTGRLSALWELADSLGLRIVKPKNAEIVIDGGDDWAGNLDLAEIQRELDWTPSTAVEIGLGRYVTALTEVHP